MTLGGGGERLGLKTKLKANPQRRYALECVSEEIHP